MIGQPYVHMRVPRSETNINPWTEEQVLHVFREALIDGDNESKNFCEHWIDSAIAAPLSTIKAFLGDPEALHGGTMGEPIIQPYYVEALRTMFWDALVDISKCAAPKYQVLNENEKAAQTIANYAWHAFVDR